MTALPRRGVLGDASLAVVAAGTALIPAACDASTVPPDHSDAALLALCAEFWRLDAEVDASDESFNGITDVKESNRLVDTYNGGLWREHRAQIDRIVATKAYTVAGIRSEAAVAHQVLHQNSEFSDPWEGGNEEERLALSLINDILGGAIMRAFKWPEALIGATFSPPLPDLNGPPAKPPRRRPPRKPKPQ